MRRIHNPFLLMRNPLPSEHRQTRATLRHTLMCTAPYGREEKQAQKQVREAAKRGDVKSARLLARELVRTRKATTQLYTNKAHMIAMGTQLQEQLAMVKVLHGKIDSRAVLFCSEVLRPV